MLVVARRTVLATLSGAVLAPRIGLAAASTGPSYALSLYGDVKYPKGFEHFDYVNPEAPKGGAVRYADIGTFDNLNPFILKGVSFVRYANSFMGSGALFDSLMAGSADEPSTAYGLIARSVELAADRMAVTFTLDERARFHNGTAITADDVVWTYQTLVSKGHPSYRVLLADVAKVEKVGPRQVRYSFKNNTNRQMPLLVAGLPVLPAKWWQGREFDKPTLDPLLGCGAYRMAHVEPGRSIVWERVKDYWAQDLPTARGTANFDRIQVDYYRDMTVLFQAFKAGLVDVREDLTAADWATGYDFPAFKQGLVVKKEVHHSVPQGMQSFVYNTRRPLFKDPRVRRALGYAFDFNWYNKTFLYDYYKRSRSYFENSELAARGLPQGAELKLLETYRGRIPDSVFTQVYDPPTYNDAKDLREGLRQAVGLLKEAGWAPKGGALVHTESGQPFAFEFLNDDPRLERLILPWLKNLERLGIRGSLRSVDSATYANRTRDFDFDMTALRYGASLTPGTELRDFYSSAAADIPGTSNVSGIKNPAVDELIELIINTDTRPDLVTRVRALDRVLLHGYYGIPNYYSDSYHVAYWNKFGQPAVHAKYVSMPAGDVPTWWIDPEKAQQLDRQREQLKSL